MNPVQRPSDERPPPAPSREWEAVVEDVLRDQERKERVRSGGRFRTLRSTGVRFGVMGVSALVLAWLWIFSPPFLDPEPPPAPPPSQRQAALRLAVFLQAQRIEAYRLRHGELPTTLQQAGEAIPGMEYVRTGPASYRLVGTLGSESLTYRSGESVEEVLGPGEELLHVRNGS